MTGSKPSPDDPDRLAAEFALGVLEGDELAEARRLDGSDPAFRAEVARWSGRLAPMLDDVAPVQPPDSAWSGIETRIAPSATVHSLTRRLRLWKGMTAGVSALAAALALFLLVPRPQQQPLPPAPAPMVAMLGDAQAPAKMFAAWDPRTSQLTIMSGAAQATPPSRSHELWVIPADGKPRSLGVMPSGKTIRIRIIQPMVSQLAKGVTLAVSVEPAGGSPTGAPTGPVIASGTLESA